MKKSDDGTTATRAKRPLEGATVGARVRSAYLLAGLNRNQLSKRAQLDYGAIQRWERGDAKPELDSLERVAAVTGRDVSELVGGTRDAASAPLYAAVEAYLSADHASERPPVSEAHARELRAMTYAGEVTLGMVSAMHRELILRDKAAKSEPPRTRKAAGRKR